MNKQDKELKLSKHFHESNLIEGFDSKEADQCVADAWEYIKEAPRLNMGRIKQVQYHCVKHQDDLTSADKGKFRKDIVYIGGRATQPPIVAKLQLQDLIQDINNGQIPPKEAHVRFERIHPFTDGNGRTGRILMWWHELQLGQEPTLITKEKVSDYYEWFR